MGSLIRDVYCVFQFLGRQAAISIMLMPIKFAWFYASCKVAVCGNVQHKKRGQDGDRSESGLTHLQPGRGQ